MYSCSEMTLPAREKLNEARYFLGQMQDTKMEPEFQYNLSAFLSAARSVTIYLQKQCAGEPEFDEWYSEKQEEMRDSPLFEAMKEARNHALKEDYPRVQGLHVNASGKENIEELSLRGHGEVGNLLPRLSNSFDVDGHEVEIRRLSVLSQLLDKEHRNEPLCGLCSSYLDELESLLSEWESKSN